MNNLENALKSMLRREINKKSGRLLTGNKMCKIILNKSYQQVSFLERKVLKIKIARHKLRAVK